MTRNKMFYEKIGLKIKLILKQLKVDLQNKLTSYYKE